TLYALIPDDWQVEPSCDGAVTEIEAVPGLGCKLVRLSAAAYFTASDDESAKFLVEPDVEASERQLELVTSAGHGFVLADRRQELVVAGSQPRIHEAGKQTRIPIEHELFARRPGTRWSPVTGPLTG